MVHAEMIFGTLGPPSSAFPKMFTYRLAMSRTKHMRPQMKYARKPTARKSASMKNAGGGCHGLCGYNNKHFSVSLL